VEYWPEIHEAVSGRSLRWKSAATIVGALLVIGGIVWEVVEEVSASVVESAIEGVNTREVALLLSEAKDADGKIAKDNAIANKAAQSAGELGAQVNGLDQFVKVQKGRVDTAVRTLQASDRKVEDARQRADLSASKAADAEAHANAAQGSATHTAASMSETLKSEQAMRDQMKALTTDRVIDDAHFEALVKSIKPFAKTQIDIAITRDPGAGSGFSLNHGKLTGIGELTIRGVFVEINEADRDKLSKAALALANPIGGAGIPVAAISEADKLPDGKPNPNAIKAGLVHLIVGLRTAAPPTQEPTPKP
jgi:hypothetical protein